jgi:TonB family protein
MALINCKECKKEVSTEAKTCPNCGIDSPGIENNHRFVGVVVLGVVISLFIYLFTINEPGSFGANQEQSVQNTSTATVFTFPHFDKNENYSITRKKMLNAGWEPFHAEDANVCSEYDTRCKGRPEMEACAGTGRANCNFLWKKNEKIIVISTIDEDATFNGIDTYNVRKNQEQSKLEELKQELNQEFKQDKIKERAKVESPAAPALVLPDTESRLIEIISKAQNESKNADNDMQRGGIKNKRDKEMCVVMDSLSVDNWVGTIEEINANSDGKGVLVIKIANNIQVKTWNNELSDIDFHTLIDPNSSLFATTSAMKKGQAVRFTGSFFRGDDTDCLEESSFSLSGKLNDPEFIFKFSNIKKGVKQEALPVGNQDKSKQEEIKQELNQELEQDKTQNTSLADTPQMMVMRMLEYALVDGGLGHESEIQQTKLKIESSPKPIKGNKKAARAFNAKGLASSKDYDFNNAVKMFEEANKLDQSDIEIISNLGFAYLKQGNFDQAQQAITTTLTMSADRATAWENLAEVFGLKGDVSKAVACFSNTYRFSKNRFKTHQFMKNLNDSEDVENIKQARAKAITWAEKAYPDISQKARMKIDFGTPEHRQVKSPVGLGHGRDDSKIVVSGVVPLFRVPPKYPARAAGQHIEGWVKVEFTIQTDGSVDNAVVVSSEPEAIFDDAALTAISQWKFKEKMVNGIAVPQRAVQRLQFKLEN